MVTALCVRDYQSHIISWTQTLFLPLPPWVAICMFLFNICAPRFYANVSCLGLIELFIFLWSSVPSSSDLFSGSGERVMLFSSHSVHYSTCVASPVNIYLQWKMFSCTRRDTNIEEDKLPSRLFAWESYFCFVNKLVLEDFYTCTFLCFFLSYTWSL